MTKLLNRRSFIESVDAILAARGDENVNGALHFIDVDNFKTINDTLGHDVGDELLRQISHQIRVAIPSIHIVSRIGGDEFAVFQVEVNSESQVAEFGKSLLSAFANSFRISGHGITTSASIGTSVAMRDGKTCRELMKAADIALYVVKAQGRNGNLIFKPSMNEERNNRIHLENEIRRAVDEGLIETHFQPLFNSKSSALVGFEALVRLQDTDGNPISPGNFIPVAEEMGLMVDIGNQVLKQATKYAACWPDHLVVSVNLSIKQFEDGHLVETVANAIKESGLPAGRLELEITEGLILQNTEWNLEQLRQLKELDVLIVMDDFGTGYSSLSYLWRFPFDKIKIDQSFLRGLNGDTEKVTEIIKTIVALGHSLDMTVTAEGVETTDQLEMLRSFDCDVVQGFLLGKPSPPQRIASLILKDFQREKLSRDQVAESRISLGAQLGR